MKIKLCLKGDPSNPPPPPHPQPPLNTPIDCVLENYFISQPKHTLWVLKRTVSMRPFFCAPETCLN